MSLIINPISDADFSELESSGEEPGGESRESVEEVEAAMEVAVILGILIGVAVSLAVIVTLVSSFLVILINGVDSKLYFFRSGFVSGILSKLKLKPKPILALD